MSAQRKFIFVALPKGRGTNLRITTVFLVGLKTRPPIAYFVAPGLQKAYGDRVMGSTVVLKSFWLLVGKNILAFCPLCVVYLPPHHATLFCRRAATLLHHWGGEGGEGVRHGCTGDYATFCCDCHNKTVNVKL